MSNAAGLVDEITAAFPASRPAPFEPLVNSVQGDEPSLTAAAFQDKDDWTVLDWKWLDRVPDSLGTALYFLSDEAVCFYIPAFMVADVNGALERVEPIYHLISGFDGSSFSEQIRPDQRETWTDYGIARWSRLTTTQAGAVVHYLEWRLTLDDAFHRPLIDQALRSFWYERATPCQCPLSTHNGH